jgi:hypothetical protein
MAEAELDLFQRGPCTLIGMQPAKAVRRQTEANNGGVRFHDVEDALGRDGVAAPFACPCQSAVDLTCGDSSGAQPAAHGLFGAVLHRHGADAAVRADDVREYPPAQAF